MKRLIFLIGLSIALAGCAAPSYYFIDGHYYKVNDDGDGYSDTGGSPYEELDRHGMWVPTRRDISRRFSLDTRVSAGACKVASTCGIGTVQEAGGHH
jgi:hypothetical protein